MPKSDLEKTATGKSSQSKGSAFELQVCKRIAQHFNQLGVDGLVFSYGDDIHRTEGSGNTVHEKGDIIIPHPLLAILFPFIIECKAVEGWTLEQIVRYDNEDNKEDWFFVEEWMMLQKQVSRDRKPIVIFKRDRSETFVLFNRQNVYIDLQGKENRFYIQFAVRNEYMAVMTLNGFLDAVAPYVRVQNVVNNFRKLQEV